MKIVKHTFVTLTKNSVLVSEPNSEGYTSLSIYLSFVLYLRTLHRKAIRLTPAKSDSDTDSDSDDSEDSDAGEKDAGKEDDGEKDAGEEDAGKEDDVAGDEIPNVYIKMAQWKVSFYST